MGCGASTDVSGVADVTSPRQSAISHRTSTKSASYRVSVHKMHDESVEFTTKYAYGPPPLSPMAAHLGNDAAAPRLRSPGANSLPRRGLGNSRSPSYGLLSPTTSASLSPAQRADRSKKLRQQFQAAEEQMNASTRSIDVSAQDEEDANSEGGLMRRLESGHRNTLTGVPCEEPADPNWWTPHVQDKWKKDAIASIEDDPIIPMRGPPPSHALLQRVHTWRSQSASFDPADDSPGKVDSIGTPTATFQRRSPSSDEKESANLNSNPTNLQASATTMARTSSILQTPHNRSSVS